MPGGDVVTDIEDVLPQRRQTPQIDVGVLCDDLLDWRVVARDVDRARCRPPCGSQVSARRRGDRKSPTRAPSVRGWRTDW